jgi:hypothetical protein
MERMMMILVVVLGAVNRAEVEVALAESSVATREAAAVNSEADQEVACLRLERAEWVVMAAVA